LLVCKRDYRLRFAAFLFGAAFLAGDLRLVAAFLFVAIAAFQFSSLFYS